MKIYLQILISVQFLWISEQWLSMLQMKFLLFSYLFQCFYLFLFSFWFNLWIYDYDEPLFSLTLKLIYEVIVNYTTVCIYYLHTLTLKSKCLCTGVDVPDLRDIMDFMYEGEAKVEKSRLRSFLHCAQVELGVHDNLCVHNYQYMITCTWLLVHDYLYMITSQWLFVNYYLLMIYRTKLWKDEIMQGRNYVRTKLCKDETV